MAELADAPDLGSGALRRGGSSPFSRTNLKRVSDLIRNALFLLVKFELLLFAEILDFIYTKVSGR